MKLNPDCVRAVMLKIEELHYYSVNDLSEIENHPISIYMLFEALPKYDKIDIYYSLDLMEQAGHISLSGSWLNNRFIECEVNYITYAGHEFLNSIRDPKHWTIIKKGLTVVRNYSLSAIGAIAEGVTTAAINTYLQQSSS